MRWLWCLLASAACSAGIGDGTQTSLSPWVGPDGSPANIVGAAGDGASDAGGAAQAAPPPIDLDQDGASPPADCDDADPARHPAAPEVCDGVDNDCDLRADDADNDTIGLGVRYLDQDGDGRGDLSTGAPRCPAPGVVDDATDHDDADPDVWNAPDTFPGAVLAGFQGFCEGYRERRVQGDVVLTRAAQADVDALGCVTEIGGLLEISNTIQVASTEPLRNLRAVGGLSIYHAHRLTQLNGLRGLTHVGGAIDLQWNDRLTQIDGLGALVSVAGDIRIIDNPRLRDVDGLHGLRAVYGTLELYDLPALAHVDGLAQVGSVGGGLELSWCRALADIGGLAGIAAVGGDLRVLGLRQLADLHGLDGLSSVGGEVVIMANPSLTRLDGLDGLLAVGASLTLTGNNALTETSALSNLGALPGSLSIVGNPSLTDLRGFSNLTTLGGALLVVQNQGLPDLDDLAALRSIDGLQIHDNAALRSVDGMGSLSTVTGEIVVNGNRALCETSVRALVAQLVGFVDPITVARFDRGC